MFCTRIYFIFSMSNLSFIFTNLLFLGLGTNLKSRVWYGGLCITLYTQMFSFALSLVLYTLYTIQHCTLSVFKILIVQMILYIYVIICGLSCMLILIISISCWKSVTYMCLPPRKHFIMQFISYSSVI